MTVRVFSQRIKPKRVQADKHGRFLELIIEEYKDRVHYYSAIIEEVYWTPEPSLRTKVLSTTIYPDGDALCDIISGSLLMLLKLANQ